MWRIGGRQWGTRCAVRLSVPDDFTGVAGEGRVADGKVGVRGVGVVRQRAGDDGGGACNDVLRDVAALDLLASCVAFGDTETGIDMLADIASFRRTSIFRYSSLSSSLGSLLQSTHSLTPPTHTHSCFSASILRFSLTARARFSLSCCSSCSVTFSKLDRGLICDLSKTRFSQSSILGVAGLCAFLE